MVRNIANNGDLHKANDVERKETERERKKYPQKVQQSHKKYKAFKKKEAVRVREYSNTV